MAKEKSSKTTKKSSRTSKGSTPRLVRDDQNLIIFGLFGTALLIGVFLIFNGSIFHF